jgi:hypoxanthine phosphoribosyltransferase
METATINVPNWFDENLVDLLEKKLDRSKIDKDERVLDWIVRQTMKALPKEITGIDTRKFGWEDVEGMIEKVCSSIDYSPELVIGIKSGGAFIANYVAKCLQVSDVDYMYVSHYSDKSRSIVKSSITSAYKQAIVKEEPKNSVENKKVLIVDDQTATGSTLIVAKDFLENKGASVVKSFCIYAKDFKPDFYLNDGLMVYTPLGKDA